MDTYKILNKFFVTGHTFTNGSLAGKTQPVKSLSVPIVMDFKNNGYSDLINSLAQEEKETNVNTVIDKETIKFSSAIYNTSDKSNLSVKFIFVDTGGTYSDNFVNAGFQQSDIDDHTNRLTKSFFKLDFYDSPTERDQNYLFSEFLNVNLSEGTTFPLNRIYWLKRDPKFIDDNTSRALYIEASFFNAKDGTIRRFINRDVSSSVTLTEYKDNPNWRFAELRVLNPHTSVNTITSNDNKLFYVEQPNGAGNSDTLITFVEIKIA